MKKIRKTDITVIIVLCLMALIPFWTGRHAGTQDAAVLVRTDKTQTMYLLTDDQTFSVLSGGYHLNFEIREGKIRVSDADCPDKTCYKTGWISRAGNCIVCIPAHVYIEIVNREEAGYDAVSG